MLSRSTAQIINIVFFFLPWVTLNIACNYEADPWVPLAEYNVVMRIAIVNSYHVTWVAAGFRPIKLLQSDEKGFLPGLNEGLKTVYFKL